MLVAPRVNPKLWEDLSDTARMRDIGLQNLQKSFVKACYPIINLENTAVLPKTKGSDQNNSIRKFSRQSQYSRPNDPLNFMHRSDPRRRCGLGPIGE